MSFAMKYAMKKRMAKDCMADGGPVVDPEKAKQAEESMRKAFHFSEGGESGSGFSDDMVDRIMKHRYAEGGKVEEPVADFESADFDYLDHVDIPTEANYTAKNSGDEDGDDLVSRAMKKRKGVA